MFKELDVPHWARSAVSNWQNRIDFPVWVTDRMIYAVMSELNGDNDTIHETLSYMATIHSRPHMNVIVIDGKESLTRVFEISDEIPADALGECVTSVIHEFWKSGHDPVDMSTIINFGPKSMFNRR